MRLLGRLPIEPFYVAVSGGSDSIGGLRFLLRSRRELLKVLFVYHRVPAEDSALPFVRSLCETEGIPLVYREIPDETPVGSLEHWWRIHRYKIFHSLNSPVITCHNIQDAAETWIFTALRGKPTVIPYRNQNVIRPFLLATRDDLKYFAKSWVEDPGNKDTRHDRNRIRHNILPEAFVINPGLFKTIRRKYLECSS